jgi:hypothetical protein
MQDGLMAAMAVPFGYPMYICEDFFTYCSNWIVTPSTDPLYLFPPNIITGLTNVYSDLTNVYQSAGLAESVNRSLVIVFAIRLDNMSPLPSNLSLVLFSRLSKLSDTIL